jgi:hypothetical protein
MGIFGGGGGGGGGSSLLDMQMADKLNKLEEREKKNW